MRGSLDDVRPGDLIGFLGNSWSSKLICLGTGGFPWWPGRGVSHVGIMGQYKGQLYLFESTELTDLPCAIKRKRIKGSQAHKLQDRLKVYEGKAWHYPLSAPLYTAERQRLNRFLRDTLGRPYDRLGAFRSGDGLSIVERWTREDQLAWLYCSEWVEAAWRYLGRLQQWDIGDLSPNELIRAGYRHGIIGQRRRLL